MGLDVGLSSLDFLIVNFEHFCGNTKPVERPESRVEHLPRRCARRRKKMKCVVVRLRAGRLLSDKMLTGNG
jgi:hypothetical protein